MATNSESVAAGRAPLDFYETPAWMTRCLLHHHPIVGSVLECCSGRDAITRVLQEAGCAVTTNDINPDHPAQTHLDAAKRTPFWLSVGPVDWVVTNPPFLQALPIIQNTLEHASFGVIMLLRKSFLEPTGVLGRPKPGDRGPWLEAHPPTGIIGLPRHSFRGTGSDSQSCDWMVWDKRPEATPFIVIDHHAERR